MSLSLSMLYMYCYLLDLQMCYTSVLSLHACEPNTLVEQKCICTKSEVFVLKKLFGVDGPSRPHDPRREREFRCVGPQKLTLSTLRDV